MSSIALRFAKLLKFSGAPPPQVSSSIGIGVQRSLRSWYSTGTLDSDGEEWKSDKDEEIDDIINEKPESPVRVVDPKRGWEFRGVHKAIICGKVGQAPVQKILRNGRTVTVFTVGTGGLFDQRIVGEKDLPRPAQWHRIAVHNESLSAYAVKQLAKNSSVYVEGDIEIRVYNDSISGAIKNIPEICVRSNGKVRLIKGGESISNIAFDDLREGLFS